MRRGRSTRGLCSVDANEYAQHMAYFNTEIGQIPKRMEKVPLWLPRWLRSRILRYMAHRLQDLKERRADLIVWKRQRDRTI
jgi:hypothetical protein